MYIGLLVLRTTILLSLVATKIKQNFQYLNVIDHSVFIVRADHLRFFFDANTKKTIKTGGLLILNYYFIYLLFNYIKHLTK
ncbi:hypothetical protein SAMN05661044_01834 [Olivibacter domesticus]|uniref:Uncharacterized protein n=1 Tax=Olivibacter domesticus TaxID=407022 RepID=A0A1H7M253_OLID1|nr:hypothetical protein SAMN05661044_01834 [Olivibacter domesticus]